MLAVCSFLLLSIVTGNLLHPGTLTYLNTHPNFNPLSINDGNLSGDWYHSACSAEGEWLSIEMSQPAPINTILYLAIDHCCPDRNIDLEFRVGTSAGPTTNPICFPGPTKKSGWY